MAVYAAFERFVFGSCHDFIMADFFAIFSVMPIKSIFNVGFSQSRLSNQLTLEDGGELLLFFACYS